MDAGWGQKEGSSQTIGECPVEELCAPVRWFTPWTIKLDEVKNYMLNLNDLFKCYYRDGTSNGFHPKPSYIGEGPSS